MATRRFWARLWPWSRRRENKSVEEAEATPRLREFIYLDEVSLRSLLSSLTGAITAEVSSAISQAEEAELAGSLSADAAVVKSEVSSRYQTSNSRTTQTTRKASVQSLFKEFLEHGGVRPTIEPQVVKAPFELWSELLEAKDSRVCLPGHALPRGSLVEIEVELEVDPLYKLSTLVSELSELDEQNADLFAGSGASLVLREAGPMNKVLQRLMAGLIPIRARAVDLVAVRDGLDEYVVHREALLDPSVKAEPIYVVGVAEHLGFWKDLRRVLFSGARFTMLCRVARDGIQTSWTPVKLAELFKDVAPDLIDQLNAAARVDYSAPVLDGDSAADPAMAMALRGYVDNVLNDRNVALTVSQRKSLDLRIEAMANLSVTATDQRKAFAQMNTFLANECGIDIDPNEALARRNDARALAGVELFPGPISVSTSLQATPANGSEALLDTEIIAIYW